MAGKGEEAGKSLGRQPIPTGVTYTGENLRGSGKGTGPSVRRPQPETPVAIPAARPGDPGHQTGRTEPIRRASEMAAQLGWEEPWTVGEDKEIRFKVEAERGEGETLPG